MRLELTDLSEQTYRTIGAVGKDPLSAIDFLRSDIQIREFYPSLRQLYPESDIKERLVNVFSEISPDTERASVIRRVQNWINGKNVPSGREDIFIIAFSLHLSEEDVSYLLGFVSDYGIHYRSPEELAYSYCLRTGRTYPEAVRFFRDLPRDAACQPAGSESALHTEDVYNLFRNIRTDREFLSEYRKYLQELNSFHRTSYEAFRTYYDILSQNPPENQTSAEKKPSGSDCRKLSVDDVVSSYLSLGMPSGKKRRHLTPLQKMLKNGWPNTTALSNILNQNENVTRKLLTLLYIVTQNIVDPEYTELDEAYLTPWQRLDEHRWILDSVLDRCGMNTLDPRNAWDWLVLYSLYTEPDEDMDERMQIIIRYLFRG